MLVLAKRSSVASDSSSQDGCIALEPREKQSCWQVDSWE